MIYKKVSVYLSFTLLLFLVICVDANAWVAASAASVEGEATIICGGPCGAVAPPMPPHPALAPAKPDARFGFAGGGGDASPSIDQRNRIFYLPGGYNFAFYNKHPKVYRTVGADHYIHAIALEILYRYGSENDLLEKEIYDQAIRVWSNPPKFGLTTEIISPEFSKLAWKAANIFDWADMLHEQLYDILADDRIKDKKKAYDEAITYYLSEKDLALSPEPISMDVMDSQYYSGDFRIRYPKFNALFWAFHWLEPTFFEGLFLFEEPVKREKILQMWIKENSDWFKNPTQRMPLMRDSANQWSKFAPIAANIFDNVHTLHGMIADIMASSKVKDKRDEIDRAIRLMQTLPGSNSNNRMTRFLPLRRDGSYWKDTSMIQEMLKMGHDPMADMRKEMEEEMTKMEKEAERIRKIPYIKEGE